MAVPKNLRVFTLFTDGVNQIGRVTGFTPPKLTRKTEAYRGGGMAANCSSSTAARLTVRCCALSVSTTTMKNRVTCTRLSFAVA